MSFYGLLIVGVIVAFGICLESVMSMLGIANSIGIQYATVSEKTALSMYSNYLSLGYNGSYAISGLLNISNMRITCIQHICIISDKYGIVSEALNTD
ncbi:MAG: hypothetical protein QW091_01970 [Candidatus Micrarchaeaceae archaeon]